MLQYAQYFRNLIYMPQYDGGVCRDTFPSAGALLLIFSPCLRNLIYITQYAGGGCSASQGYAQAGGLGYITGNWGGKGIPYFANFQDWQFVNNGPGTLYWTG